VEKRAWLLKKLYNGGGRSDNLEKMPTGVIFALFSFGFPLVVNLDHDRRYFHWNLWMLTR
jgi:hypothetical protein